MQDTYSRYRDLKRDIRDMAATDIQRAYRVCVTMKLYTRVIKIEESNRPDHFALTLHAGISLSQESVEQIF